MYGVMMMNTPKLGLKTAELIVTISVAAFLIDCDFDIANMATCTPSESMLKHIMVEEVGDSVLVENR